MRLQEIRMECGYKQKEVASALREEDRRIDWPMYSKMERGTVLPTPQILRCLCTLFACKPLDIYTREEIDLINCLDVQSDCERPKEQERRRERKVQFRLNEQACKSFTMEKLRACGYPSKTAWFYAKLKQLDGEYAARMRYAKSK